jgi:sterol desaturase/sphingolipid hydroxylase (fatty acid hydroxylase superfamily)
MTEVSESLMGIGAYSAYLVLLITVLLTNQWESVAPRRPLGGPIRPRWSRNLGIYLSSLVTVRLVFPIFGFEMARLTVQSGWGLSSVITLPLWLNVLFGILVIDLSRYCFHWLEHRYVFLWRIHRLHHTDQDFDFTTSVRNHPLEAIAALVIALITIYVFGIHPLTVILYDALAVASTTFGHGNIRLSTGADRILRSILVTPDMHRIHHSSLPREFNSNIGAVFSFWDRMFGTYVDQPRRGHEGMSIGLPDYSRDQGGKLINMLLDPFTSSSRQTINHVPEQEVQ